MSAKIVESEEEKSLREQAYSKSQECLELLRSGTLTLQQRRAIRAKLAMYLKIARIRAGEPPEENSKKENGGVE